MKRFTLVLFVAALLSACGHSCDRAPKVAPPATPTFFVSGLYACFDRSDYCHVWDTIAITKDHFQANVYHLTRLTAFQRNLEDVYYGVERDTMNWLGTYDPAKGLMRGIDDGPDLLFHPQANVLYLDNHLFTKIE